MTAPTSAHDAADGTHQHAWAHVLIGTLAACGASRAVVSPGSRSTPLVLALLEQARFDHIDVVDERVAGFVALGLARADGRAPLLVCTSGSAVANWHPAVVEADAARLPLLLLSADRPLELARSGANQTIDQVGLFGPQVRATFDLEAGHGQSSLEAARRLAAQAWMIAHRTPAGPVQLNLRFHKPLEPRDAAGRGHAVQLASAVVKGAPRVFSSLEMPDPAAVGEVLGRLRAAARPLLISGPRPFAATDPRPGVARLVRESGIPTVGDPGSWFQGIRGVAGHSELLLGSAWSGAEPDLIVQVGNPPTSSAWEQGRVLPKSSRLVVLGDGTWPDPLGRACLVVGGDADLLCAAIAKGLRRTPLDLDPQWQASWRAADDVARSLIAGTSEEAALSELAAVAAVTRAIPAGGLLVLGNSLAIRHAGTVGVAGRAGIAVATQRGASGIDGLIAGAAGAVRARGGVAVLILGDLSALHDLGGLAAARSTVGSGTLVVVVLDNQGGRIFEELPVAQHRQDLRSWTTPDAAPDLVAVARAFGLPGHRVQQTLSLRRRLREVFGKPDGTASGSVSVLVAEVPPSDAVSRGRRLREDFARICRGA